MARCNIWTIGAGCMVVPLATGDSECYCQDSAAVLGRPQASYTPANELAPGLRPPDSSEPPVGGSELPGASATPIATTPSDANAGPQPGAWGIASGHVYPLGDKVAPNGVEFTPILSLDLHTNLWLWSASVLS